VAANLPANIAEAFKNRLDIYTDSVYLNGMTCVALATGMAKESLKGKYLDVCQDLEDIINQAAAVKADPELYSLHTKFLGGLPNEEIPDRPQDEPFAFPGF